MQNPVTKNTFDQAYAACKADGATLISAETLKEFEAVTTWLKTDIQPSLDIWVDIVYKGPAEGPFSSWRDYRWNDGTPAHSSTWAKNEPSAKTTMIGDPLRVVIWRARGRGYKLDNRSPYKLASYACEKPRELECEQIGCWSSRGYKQCTPTVMTKNGAKQEYAVSLERQHSTKTCKLGESFGLSEDKSTVWVDKGCKGLFTVCTDSVCPDAEVHCADLTSCIPDDWICDGFADCDDNSDEQSCKNP